MNCDQCEFLFVNGIGCHEIGCPNERKKYVKERGEWVRFVNCFVCGFEVEVGESCCEVKS